jgi:polar amino acid transport system substrate-binding protein
MVTAYMIKVSGGSLVPAGQMFDAAPMGWVVAKGSPLALSLRQALERLIASGRYTKILDNWGVGVGAISNPQINAGIS